MKKSFLLMIFAVLTALGLSGCVINIDENDLGGGKTKSFSEAVEMNNVLREADLNIGMNAAKAYFDVSKNKLVEGNFRYNSESLKPDFRVDAGSIEIENRRGEMKFTRPINKWDVKLTDKLPMNMKFHINASDANLDFDGMKIKKLDMNINASDVKLLYGQQNTETIERIHLDAAASSVNLGGLGNLNFRDIDVRANASTMTLDMGGDYKSNGNIRLMADASTVKLRLPDKVGVKIFIEKSDISTVKVSNPDISTVSKNEYVSTNYTSADTKLIIYVNMNVTTLTID